MSIDSFVYVKPDPKSPTGRTYNWATVREITDDLNNNHDGKEYGLHTVYVFQHGRKLSTSTATSIPSTHRKTSTLGVRSRSKLSS